MGDIAAAREAVTKALADMEAALEAIENPQEGADTDALERKFSEAEERHASAIKTLERAEKVAEARKNLPVQVETPEPEQEERKAPTPQMQVVSEPHTYRKDNQHETRWYRDLALAQVRGDQGAAERLNRHGAEVRATLTSAQLRSLGVDAEQRTVISGGKADTGGAGAFVPPLWLVEDYAIYARPNKIAANLIGERELPPGIDNINWPQLTTGTSTAVQTAELGTFSSTDFVATPVSASVFTVGGTVSISLQALEQSPLALDEVIFGDLAADHAQRLDIQVINGSGSSGQATGLLNVGSIKTSTYTTGTPTAAGLYSKLQDIVQQIHTGRYLPPDLFLMHPRRWAWLLAQSDSQNRPLVVPGSVLPTNQAVNAMGVIDIISSQGYAGVIGAMPVFTDANVPTNLSSTQDAILAFRLADQRLYSSPVQAEAFRAAGITTGYVTFRQYAYHLFFGGLYPASIGSIGGTGLTTPSF